MLTWSSRLKQLGGIFAEKAGKIKSGREHPEPLLFTSWNQIRPFGRLYRVYVSEAFLINDPCKSQTERLQHSSQGRFCCPWLCRVLRLRSKSQTPSGTLNLHELSQCIAHYIVPCTSNVYLSAESVQVLCRRYGMMCLLIAHEVHKVQYII